MDPVAGPGGGGAFFFGETFSMVDLCLAPWLQRALTVSCARTL